MPREPKKTPANRTSPTPRKLKSGADAHVFTDEDRAKAAEARKVKQAEREEQARELLSQYVDPALEVLRAALDSQDESVRARAAKDILDRVLGRPTQTVKHTGADVTGPVEVRLTFDHRADG
jgi:hypothetical protein